MNPGLCALPTRGPASGGHTPPSTCASGVRVSGRGLISLKDFPTPTLRGLGMATLYGGLVASSLGNPASFLATAFSYDGKVAKAAAARRGLRAVHRDIGMPLTPYSFADSARRDLRRGYGGRRTPSTGRQHRHVRLRRIGGCRKGLRRSSARAQGLPPRISIRRDS